TDLRAEVKSPAVRRPGVDVAALAVAIAPPCRWVGSPPRSRRGGPASSGRCRRGGPGGGGSCRAGPRDPPPARALRRGAGLPAGPHGSPPPGEVRDAPLLLVAQAHHVQLADAVALRSVQQPLAVRRRVRVIVHRSGRRVGQLLT